MEMKSFKLKMLLGYDFCRCQFIVSSLCTNEMSLTTIINIITITPLIKMMFSHRISVS